MSNKIGTRCDICTGCGRCVSANGGIHVLTHSASGIGKIALPNRADILETSGKERLVAVDVGTTTIAMQLYGRDGKVQDTYAVVNPQIAYGADVLSRILAAENAANAAQMQQQVLEVLKQGIRHFRTCLEEGEGLRMVIAANTTMVYLLMGWNPAELGIAPFHAAHLMSAEIIVDDVHAYVFPGISAFVGGDIVAGVLASGMAENDAITLLIDLGTNGEMVLGNRDRMLACATAAGPAFEGGVNRGVWGADMICLLAELRSRSILDETGLLAEPYFEQGICIGDVCMTQEAVRAIQLAKAAIAAGIQILVREYGIMLEQIERVVLSGGFGYYLKPEAAAAIGLLPKELLEKTVAGGNTALAGAACLGWNRTLQSKLEEIIHTTTTMNLAEIPDFYDIYISSMNLI